MTSLMRPDTVQLSLLGPSGLFPVTEGRPWQVQPMRPGAPGPCSLVGFQVAVVDLSFLQPLSPHLHSRISTVSLLMAVRAVSGIHRHFEKATVFLASVLKILDYPKN